MALHDGAAAILRIRTGSRGRPGLIAATFTFGAAGAMTIDWKSHPEIDFVSLTDGVYTMRVPQAGTYVPLGTGASCSEDDSTPTARAFDGIAGTCEVIFASAAAPPGNGEKGSISILGLTGRG